MEEQKNNNLPPIFVVSGGRGIAGHTMVLSLLIQYSENNIPVKIIPNVQSEPAIKDAVQTAKKVNGILAHTMVNGPLRRCLIEECRKEGVRDIDFMGKLADYLEKELGLESENTPGLYRRINAPYFDRIDAIEYTLEHDDGMNAQRLLNAEIILTGVSRCGKTPLSVYMSMFGWKVANVPLVKGIDPPKELFKVDPKRVFGLYISKSHLISQRHKRLQQFGVSSNPNYVEDRYVLDELRYANFIFDKGGFTKINVNNKPIETSANEIIGLVYERFGHRERTIPDKDAPKLI